MPEEKCTKLRTALYMQAQLITETVEDKIEKSDRFATRAIKDMGDTTRAEANDFIRKRRARIAPQDYVQLTNPIRTGDMLESGNMTVRGCTGANVQLATELNPVLDACHGFSIIDFAHGFETGSTSDYRTAYGTPELCILDYAAMQPKELAGWFVDLQEDFTDHGFDSFELMLERLVIQHGQANASVLGGTNYFNVTTNGWEAPPTHAISIWFLQQYRDHLIVQGGLKENEPLRVEMAPDDAYNAIIADRLALGLPVGDYTGYRIDEDPLSVFYNKQFIEYGNIRIFMNRTPIRGFFIASGQTGGGATTWRFIRIYPTINEALSGGGVGAVPNPDYKKATVWCEGAQYPVVSLLFHIDPRSFQRWGLLNPSKPVGGKNAGVNFEVQVLDGPNIQPNPWNDKFQIAARHQFRFRSQYPEFSGAIVYRHSVREGYVITPNNPAVDGTVDSEPASYERGTAIDPTPDETEHCADCYGQTALPGGACATDANNLTLLTLLPCPEVTTAFIDGENESVVFTVERTGSLAGTSGVNYATANGTATAATEYTSTSGSLAWADGEGGAKTITVPLLASPVGADKTFTLTLSSVSGAVLAACAVATVTIEE